jgi:antagonist of KipI
MSSLRLKKAGISTIQHISRFEYREYGVPVGGPLDQYNAARVRQLLNLAEDVPVIETFYNLLKLEVGEAVNMTVSGAAKTILKNGKEISVDEVISLVNGDIISIGQLEAGFISYIAFSHHLKLPLRLGSKGSIQALDESNPNLRQLKDGDTFDFGSSLEKLRSREPLLRKRYIASSMTLRFTEGPEYGFLDKSCKNLLESIGFEVTSDIDRMGYRLQGPSITANSTQSLSSRATLPGTIQLTPAGDLLVLQADAQTTGGYPRIMQLIAYDLSMLAQAAPGTKIRFQKIGTPEATKLFDNAFYLRGFLPNSY